MRLSQGGSETGFCWCRKAAKPAGHTAALLPHPSAGLCWRLLGPVLTEQAPGITSSTIPPLSEELPYSCTSWWAGPPSFPPSSYFPLPPAWAWTWSSHSWLYYCPTWPLPQDSAVNLASTSSLRGCWKYPVSLSGTGCWAFVAEKQKRYKVRLKQVQHNFSRRYGI